MAEEIIVDEAAEQLSAQAPTQTPPNDKYIRALYEQTKNTYDVGGYDNFSKMLTSDAKFRNAFFTDAGAELDLGADLTSFESTLGLSASKKKESSPLTQDASTIASSFDIINRYWNFGKIICICPKCFCCPNCWNGLYDI